MSDYKNGLFGGVVGLLLSHPIDTIKTYNQSGISFNYNVKSLYKGLSAPLVCIGIEKSIVFGTYDLCRKQNVPICVSGAISGFFATLIVSPYERIKILKQVNANIDWNIKSLFKGLKTSFTREVPGFAIYFQTYESFKSLYINKLSTSSTSNPSTSTSTSNPSKIPLLYSFVTGGVSGSFAWLFIYPQDRIKTIIQSSNNTTLHNSKTIAKVLYDVGGVRELYRGFSFAVARAMLLHSGAFATVEYLKGNRDLEIL